MTAFKPATIFQGFRHNLPVRSVGRNAGAYKPSKAWREFRQLSCTSHLAQRRCDSPDQQHSRWLRERRRQISAPLTIKGIERYRLAEYREAFRSRTQNTQTCRRQIAGGTCRCKGRHKLEEVRVQTFARDQPPFSEVSSATSHLHARATPGNKRVKTVRAGSRWTRLSTAGMTRSSQGVGQGPSGPNSLCMSRHKCTAQTGVYS